MKRTLPKYVTAYNDRHGKVRHRFRRTGQKPYSFKSKVGSPEFLNEYHACLSGQVAPQVVAGKGRTVRGSFHDLIARFYLSTEWAAPSDSTRRTYRGIIERFRTEHGHRMVADLRYAHVDRILASKASTPAAANNLRKVLIRLMEFAVKTEMATRNPVRATRPYKTNPEGWHTWTEEEIAQFKARHPVGTKARLALALMLFTGQRRSDIVQMGLQHIKGGKISVCQRKTHKRLRIPIHSELRAAIDAMAPHQHLTLLVTSFGKPFTDKGFGNWFRDRCDEANLPQCSSHGLRKAISRRMAEIGLSHSQAKAITGHATDKEFSRYARAANQEALAEQAMANLEAEVAKQNRKPLKTRRKVK